MGLEVELPPNVNLMEESVKKAPRHIQGHTLQTLEDGSLSINVLPFDSTNNNNNNNNDTSMMRMTLNKSVFDAPLRKDILQRVVKWQLAKARSGNHKTKSRSEVRGSTRKMWRQKGSGRARISDRKAPHWRGGYTVFGPVVRDHSYKLNKKVRNMGMRVALSAKLREGKLAIVDSFEVPDIKTKHVATLLKEKEWDNLLFIDSNDMNANFKVASTNLKDVDLLPQQGANVYSILKRDLIILSKDAAEELQHRLAVE